MDEIFYRIQDMFAEREAKLTLIGYICAALIWFGVIDFETLPAVQALIAEVLYDMQAVTDGAGKTLDDIETGGLNKIVAAAVAGWVTTDFKISRGLAKNEAR